MRAVGGRKKGTGRPGFESSISIDFKGAETISDADFLLMKKWRQSLKREFSIFRGCPLVSLFPVQLQMKRDRHPDDYPEGIFQASAGFDSLGPRGPTATTSFTTGQTESALSTLYKK